MLLFKSFKQDYLSKYKRGCLDVNNELFTINKKVRKNEPRFCLYFSNDSNLV